MDFEKFEIELLFDLKNNNGACVRKLEEKKELILKNLYENAVPENLSKFVEALNYIILHSTSKFILIEKILKHPYFSKVYSVFQNSDILIEACKIGRKNTLQWLLTMNINPYVQDKDGMTALMHASKNPDLLYVVKNFLSNIDCLNMVDNNGKNALFYALHNIAALNELLKTNINVNQLNRDNESLLIYCCKYDIFEVISYLITRVDIDVNLVDNEDRTAAMYLADKGRTVELFNLNKRNCNYEFRNKRNESTLSLVLKNLYTVEKHTSLYLPYIRILTTFVQNDLNFNLPIDEDENTPIMLFIIVNDIYTLNYVLNYSKNYDLSIKNKNGESACSLALKYNLPKGILDFMMNHPTFDINYKDQKNNNNMLMLSAMAEFTLIDTILEIKPLLINSVNSKNENALIIATKLNRQKSVLSLIQHKIDINHQDNLGNTALYYAIDSNNVDLIKLFVSNHADKTIKNNDGISPLDFAKKLGYKYILNILKEEESVLLSPLTHEEVKDYYFQFTKENDSEIKYKETEEYLYPYVSDRYSEIDLSYDLILAEKTVYLNSIKPRPYSRHSSSVESCDMDYLRNSITLSNKLIY